MPCKVIPPPAPYSATRTSILPRVRVLEACTGLIKPWYPYTTHCLLKVFVTDGVPYGHDVPGNGII